MEAVVEYDAAVVEAPGRLDIEKAIAEVASGDDLDALEKGFVEHAKSYSERKGVSYTAWRQAGVPAAVLREAGIRETRRR